MPHSRTMRSPILGVIFPGHTITVSFEKPLSPEEIPIVFTRKVGAVLVKKQSATEAVIESKTTLPAVYVLVAVPQKFMFLAFVPWRQALAFLKTKQGWTALINQLGSMLFER